MIKKLLSVLVLVFALSGSVLAQQSMSDQQVLEYVKTGMQQGKDQRQIATELARRGVTQEQAKRVKKLYEQQNGSADKDANATMQNRNRLREKTKTQEDIYVTENFTFDQRPAADRVVGRTRRTVFLPIAITRGWAWAIWKKCRRIRCTDGTFLKPETLHSSRV